MKVYAESYRVANTAAVKHHIMPCLARKPNEVILHVGTNDLRDKNSIKIVANINDICNIVKSKSPETKITISELVTRTDKTEYKQKVKEVNVSLVDLCNQNNWDLIYHNNIEVRHLIMCGMIGKQNFYLLPIYTLHVLLVKSGVNMLPGLLTQLRRAFIIEISLKEKLSNQGLNICMRLIKGKRIVLIN